MTATQMTHHNLNSFSSRHGWGCVPDPDRGVGYFASAACQCANAESREGQSAGAALKEELRLAIFELGNCFRYGWGVRRDPVAARQYYETAAKLGDIDAMNEAARCYLDGVGGKKDRVSSFLIISTHVETFMQTSSRIADLGITFQYMASRYYRLAEKNGSKILGNTWYVAA